MFITVVYDHLKLLLPLTGMVLFHRVQHWKAVRRMRRCWVFAICSSTTAPHLLLFEWQIQTTTSHWYGEVFPLVELVFGCSLCGVFKCIYLAEHRVMQQLNQHSPAFPCHLGPEYNLPEPLAIEILSVSLKTPNFFKLRASPITRPLLVSTRLIQSSFDDLLLKTMTPFCMVIIWRTKETSMEEKKREIEQHAVIVLAHIYQSIGFMWFFF